MPERLRLAVHLGAWCALRYGEVAELRRSDIDVKNGIIHVRRGVTGCPRNASSDAEDRRRGPKTCTVVEAPTRGALRRPDRGTPAR